MVLVSRRAKKNLNNWYLLTTNWTYGLDCTELDLTSFSTAKVIYTGFGIGAEYNQDTFCYDWDLDHKLTELSGQIYLTAD